MKTPHRSLMVLAAIITVSFIACSGNKSSSEGVKLQGAGASFPAPLYQKWFKSYSASHDGVQIDYQSVGSGSGVKSVIDKTVDFGASDAAMSPEDMAKVDGGVQLLPMTAGCIVLTYNLKGVTGLKLSRQAYAGIFLGKVKKWNDPLIAKANPGVNLPDEPINVVVRADGSGTTFVFTKHLSAISPEFAQNPGVNTLPNWPVGTRSKGNEGVTASVMIDSRGHWLHRIRLRQESELAHGHSGKQVGQLRRAHHRVRTGGPGDGAIPRQPHCLGS